MSKPYSGKLSYKWFPSTLDYLVVRFKISWLNSWKYYISTITTNFCIQAHLDKFSMKASVYAVFSYHTNVSEFWKQAYILSSAIIQMFLNFDVSCILHKLVVVLLQPIFRVRLWNFEISVDYLVTEWSLTIASCCVKFSH